MGGRDNGINMGVLQFTTYIYNEHNSWLTEVDSLTQNHFLACKYAHIIGVYADGSQVMLVTPEGYRAHREYEEELRKMTQQAANEEERKEFIVQISEVDHYLYQKYYPDGTWRENIKPAIGWRPGDHIRFEWKDSSPSTFKSSRGETGEIGPPWSADWEREQIASGDIWVRVLQNRARRAGKKLGTDPTGNGHYDAHSSSTPVIPTALQGSSYAPSFSVPPKSTSCIEPHQKHWPAQYAGFFATSTNYSRSQQSTHGHESTASFAPRGKGRRLG
ncbi:hypothetical protein [Streptomyces sp. NPDC029554]|uniref:hypothetical protein n=1 Tax=Streptomyces sp. NPDC029554 TaxID=3155126 RepID=UPI0033FDB384